MAKRNKAWLEWQPTGWVPKVAREYRKAIFNSMAQSMDAIRLRAAAKEIIPNRSGTRNPYYAAKKQPPVSGRLTDRTGSLIKMLRDKAGFQHKWTVTASRARIDTMGMQGMVKVASSALTPMERYSATFRVNIKESAVLATEIMAKVKVRRRRIKQTPQTLAMRFRHETGIRGARRPFMEPAAKEQVFSIQKIIQERINRFTKTV